MDANGKRYLREFLSAMAAYSIIVPISVRILRGHEHTPLGYAIAFLPIIPSALALWAFMRMFRGLDELQRRIQLEAVAFSFSGDLPHHPDLGVSAKRWTAPL